MSSTIITSTTTAGDTKPSSRFKLFLNEHCYIVDFLSASIIICLCLIILLPRVHESFLPDDDDNHIDHNDEIQEQQQPLDTNLTNSQPLGAQPVINITNQKPSDNNLLDQQTPGTIGGNLHVIEPDNGHHQHHDHFPAGELLICIGFFVFYCTGLGLAGLRAGTTDQELYLARRRKRTTSTVCCSSSRCPPSVQQAAAATKGLDTDSGQAIVNQERTEMINELTVLSPIDESLMQQPGEADCVMLLNRHHQHHTHSSHRGHQLVPPQTSNIVKNRRQNYGSTQGKNIKPSYDKNIADTYNGQVQASTDIIRVTPDRNATIIVDEIRITSGLVNEDKAHWPHSLRLLLFSLVLALVLIFFELNVQGMIRAVKVFRATSTGALLYVAFFIMLPRRSAGCNSCKEEET